MQNKKIQVRNRSNGSIGYTIPDLGNYHRSFQAQERKELPFEEVQKLAFIPGGEYLLQHYLVIEDLDARNEILGAVELEYDYTEEDVKNLLLYGSQDALLDCLDFAPIGVIDLVKKLAVDLELNDIRKRRIILEKTGYNIDNAIMIKSEENNVTEAPENGGRRVKPVEESGETPTEAPVRRYNINKN